MLLSDPINLQKVDSKTQACAILPAMKNRDLDLQVLETVFKFPRKKVFLSSWDGEDGLDIESGGDYYYIPSGKPRKTHKIDAVPVPSFSGRAAWLVVEQMEKLGYWCQMNTSSHPENHGRSYSCGFTPHGNGDAQLGEWADAPKITEAICLAAIKALMSEA